ncbi:MAG: hypothetical protein A3D57_00315 [Candidatus Sungbacteria bacterium RIFCSPHIGHO2_02_FULL_46_12]|nr:MAG: hypothetical protein A3D57_00315 [Candidatus Sungbacteria bacterium RIFCSPHIGHO2_02_FULL_46_12]
MERTLTNKTKRRVAVIDKRDRCCEDDCYEMAEWYLKLESFKESFLFCTKHAEKRRNFPHAWAGWNHISLPRKRKKVKKK